MYKLLNDRQTLKACKALLAHITRVTKQKASESTKKSLLHDSDDERDQSLFPIWITLTTKRHIAPSRSLQPAKIPLPHALNTDPSTTICLITADPQRVYKDIVASSAFPAELRARVARVIGYSKLTAKYKQYEAQRQLYAEHDVFLGDDRIINRLPKVLGKTFYKNMAKRPIPVVISPKPTKENGKRLKMPKTDGGGRAGTPADIAAEIEKALGSALVNLSPSTNTAVRVGHAGLTPEQLAANVSAVAAALVEKHVPKKWANVKSIYVKGKDTAALPIWMTDELWLEEKDVLPAGKEVEKGEAPKLINGEKPNVGKKRKSLDAREEEAGDQERKVKKAKPPKGNDDQLDKQIAERNARLKKQKAKAKAAMED